LPDAVVVLVHHVVAQERDAPGGQAADSGGDVGDAPAEDGVAGLGDLGHGRDPEHRAVRVEDVGEFRALGQRQAEHLLIEHA
jgi:hypothetical protein